MFGKRTYYVCNGVNGADGMNGTDGMNGAPGANGGCSVTSRSASNPLPVVGLVLAGLGLVRRRRGSTC